LPECACGACRAERATRAAREALAALDAALADLRMATEDLKSDIRDHQEDPK